MRKITLLMLACCAMAASAQDVPVNREKYPDYVDPRKAYEPEPRLMKFVPVEGESKSRAAISAKDLPEYWNNADTKYFPPVFNQDGGSCGSASRICYMFTHEINALRDADASLPENQYPSHFVWLLTSGNSGKDAFVEFVGVPNVTHYGGRTYSSLFGYQEETNNYFGWMTGYDKWMNAIGNRMLRPTSNPLTVDTEEGRLAAKAWLYNHAGDTDFKAGGLIGLGVASGGQWSNIPSTPANDAAGVTGKYFVHRWGTQVDHAVTMVGWDDRIEFDLNKDGKFAEDEKGAWIIVNSWGNWCNDGFIYCPYKYAGPVSDPTTGAMTGGYWSGELYHARKNFRPTRVIKLKMDYSHRSELLLQAGISTDLNATEPDGLVDMHHFRYAGDGANGDANPAPAIPMLGKWKNEWHEEPMEFCYDLTDLSANYDTNKPLKYFFVINRKNETNRGCGNVYEASIVDMEKDLEGIETPFDLGGEKFTITKEGHRLIISAIVYGAGYEPVNNISYQAGVLSWNAPKKSSYQVESYNIYKDGALVGNTTEKTYTINGGQEYGVSVIYTDGTESAKVSCMTAVLQNTVASSFEQTGFTIPNVFANHYKECTIEFFIKPTRFANWNCEAGPGWGTYMQHMNSNGKFTCGWNTGNHRIDGSSTPLKLNEWQHVAIVVNGNTMTMYLNGESVGEVTSSSYSGIGGFGDFVFASGAANKAQNAQYDEIRIWGRARTNQEIRGIVTADKFKKQEFYGDILPKGLLAYYKGDTFQDEAGNYYMRDCVGGNHALVQASGNPQVSSNFALEKTALGAKLKIDALQDVYACVPVKLSVTRGDAINKLWWTIPACGISEMKVESPTIMFNEPGNYKCIVGAENYNGRIITDSIEVEVKGAAVAIDPTFTMSATTIACSDHLSMMVNNYVDACSYEWILPGAEVETVYGAKAGATYVADGDYTVTLKMTTADGRTAESSQTVHVTAVAPKADFIVDNPIVLKETPVQLSSTSRYGATAYEWTLDGQAQKTIITEGNKEQTWVPKYPGKYNISLKASNAIGSNSVTKERALIVTNDDSKNGLSFSKETSKVTLTNAPATLNEFTIEFWANPAYFATNCWSFGDSEETLLLKVGNYGEMSVYINGTVITSEIGYFIPGEWNHYAIQRTSAGAVRFMRNGVLFKSYTAQYKGEITGITKFAIGGPNAPVIGVMDEFRLWNKLITNVKDLCNQHMDNPQEYVESSGLLAYYDFNQTGGDVIDRSGNGNDGIRSGFGPDGDAWGLSKGVFSLYFGDKLPNETVTSIDEAYQDEPVSAGRKGVYTLSGQYVGKTIKGLPAGMYIVDGKKVVLK